MSEPTTAGAKGAAAPKPPARVKVTWAGGIRFDAGRPGGPAVRIDGTAETGPSPVDMLVSALASCAAVDVVEILTKRRTPVRSLTVDVLGERVDGIPRRLRHVTLDFHIAGAGIEREHAERAIDLAINKYCSVRDSLAKDIPVDWSLTLDQ
jgi:putative redox protein